MAIHLNDVPKQEQDVVLDQLGQYYNWLCGHAGGVDSDKLLEHCHSQPARKYLLERMDDLNVLLGYFAPLTSGTALEACRNKSDGVASNSRRRPGDHKGGATKETDEIKTRPDPTII